MIPVVILGPVSLKIPALLIKTSIFIYNQGFTEFFTSEAGILSWHIIFSLLTADNKCFKVIPGIYKQGRISKNVNGGGGISW